MRWAVRSLSVTKGTTLEVFLNGLSDDAEAEAEALFEARGLTTGVRLFFVFAPGRQIIVLDGYVKKRTSIPAKIMARIRNLQKDAERALHRQERTRTLNKRP